LLLFNMPTTKRCVVAVHDSNKKRREEDPLAAHKGNVLESVLDSDLPEGSKDMLKVLLPFAYGQPRHEHQNKVLDMVLETFARRETDLQGDVAEKQKQVEMSEQQRTDLNAAIAAAEAVVQEASLKVATSADLKSQSEEALAQACNAHNTKQSEHNTLVCLGNKAEETKLLLELAFTSKAELVDLTPKNASKVASFKSQLDVLVQDKNLVTAVQLSLGKEPTERGPFERLVLEQLDKELSRIQENIEREIAESEPAKTASQDALTSLAAVQQQAAQHAEEMRDSHKQCVAERKEAEVDLGVAKSSMKCFEKESKQIAADLEVAQAALLEFQHGPMESLRLLTTGTTLEPQEPVAEVLEEPVAEVLEEPVTEVLQEPVAEVVGDVVDQKADDVQPVVEQSDDVNMAQEAAPTELPATELPVDAAEDVVVPEASLKVDECASVAPPPPELVGCAGA